jgi:hypothetical protein
MRHHRKSRKRKGGAWEDYLPSFLKSKPATPQEIVQDPTKVANDAGNVATDTTQEAANNLGVSTGTSPGGIPGSTTAPEDAAMLGGRRRRTRKHRRKSRRRH